MPDFQPPIQPSGPDPGSGGATPLAQTPMQVIQPDNPMPPSSKPGSWDDILPQHEQPQTGLATVTSGHGNPADNQPLPAKLHDLTDSLRAVPHRENTEVVNQPPVKGQALGVSVEPRGMFDALDEPTQTLPQTGEPPAQSEVATIKTEATTKGSISPQKSDIAFHVADPRSSNDTFEQDLENTFATRFARYGKAAVTTLAIPFLSSSKLTKRILKNGLSEVGTGETENSSDWVGDLQTQSAPVQTSDAASVIDYVCKRYGIPRHEALEKIHQAVNLANQQAGQEVARILEHDPNIETDDEVGVYIDVEGGRALSLNSEDVMRVLGQYMP